MANVVGAGVPNPEVLAFEGGLAFIVGAKGGSILHGGGEGDVLQLVETGERRCPGKGEPDGGAKNEGDCSNQDGGENGCDDSGETILHNRNNIEDGKAVKITLL